jgi:3D (Asp-Asp-Asp) domain-containing protein
MKRSTKYLIARLGIMALCMVMGFGLGWLSKETEVVEVNVTRPIEYIELACVNCEPKVEPTYKEMQIVATAYCPCEKCCEKSDGITATGVKAKANHTIAADPNILPYGTEILCGMGEFVVEDTGGALKGKNQVDFFFDTHEEALKFGRQQFTIWIKE